MKQIINTIFFPIIKIQSIIIADEKENSICYRH